MNNEKIQSLNIIDEQIFSFPDRLKSIIGNDSIRTFAKKCDVSDTIVRRYLKGGSEPTLKILLNMANAGNVDVAWLATGSISQAKTATAHYNSDDFMVIPDLNLKVAAGNGLCLINENDSIGQIILNKDWLRKQNLINASLAIFHVKGDSMEPTIHDEDIVLVNVKDEGWTGALSGIFVLRVEDLLFVKRIMVDPIKQGMHIISDNTIYQPDFIKFDDSTGAKIKVLAKVEKVLTKPVSKVE